MICIFLFIHPPVSFHDLLIKFFSVLCPGNSHSGEIIDLGADLGIIKKSGSWYSYNDTKLGQGRDAAKQCIADNPELAEELEGLIFEALKKKE